MTGGRGVQDGDGHVGVHHVQHRGHQPAGIEGHGLAGLQIDLRAVVLPHARDAAAEAVQIIAFASDVMTAAEIDPCALGQLFAETGLHGIQGAFQRVGALFAQGMEMQTGDALRQRFGQLVRPNAQTGTRGTGIVDGHGAFGMFGIDAQAAAYPATVVPAPGLDLGAEAFPLGQGVENQMIHQRQ